MRHVTRENLKGWEKTKLNLQQLSIHNALPIFINNLREKISCLDQDSNPGFQLYALAL